MKDTRGDGPGHVVLSEVMPILKPLYGLIEGGVQKARKITDDEYEGKYDPYLFPILVRAHVCRGLDALAAGKLPFTRREIPNDGIEITYGSRTIKIWKATPDGELPGPGQSQAKIDFYNCNLFGDDPIIYQSLIVLWEQVGSGLTIQLVAPRSANSPKEIGEQLWAVTVPHPATLIEPEAVAQRDEDDLKDFKRADDRPSTQTSESEGDDE